jgi:hypothetical protein
VVIIIALRLVKRRRKQRDDEIVRERKFIEYLFAVQKEKNEKYPVFVLLAVFSTLLLSIKNNVRFCFVLLIKQH